VVGSVRIVPTVPMSTPVSNGISQSDRDDGGRSSRSNGRCNARTSSASEIGQLNTFSSAYAE